MSTIKIPERILNNVKAQFSTITDCNTSICILQKEISKIKRVRDIARLRMWDGCEEAIEDNLPTHGIINTEKWTYEFPDNNRNPYSSSNVASGDNDSSWS